MTETFLTEQEAQDLAAEFISRETTPITTQQIIDTGTIPRLRGFHVRPGKVSDSIFGGRGSYKKGEEKVEFENPSLQTADGTPLRIMVRTKRISTHDINRGSIPFKDQVLALNHNFMRRLVTPFLGTSQFDVEGLSDSDVVIVAENLKTIPIEMVFRAYMARSTTSTSLYQAWLRGDSTFAGYGMIRDLIPNGPLPYIMDTPSTKSDDHDETVSSEFLISRDFCSERQYLVMKNNGLAAFGAVSQFLRQRGIILVDTKTEHGVTKDERIVSQDELYTMDSSRFWLLADYKEQIEKLKRREITELDPRSYSKEFARGFSEGERGYTPEERAAISARYIMGIQHLLGRRFTPDLRPWERRVVSGLEQAVKLAA
ncbi:MAG: phosphoribosylaminoimidazolesuccinocarboxamide synthase [Candidatus Woesearchaeota archaeon]|nr:MAG: phosphoribosylaminoimidazolesuccinocarboxamide synthase [Candidatus Woesearchaeota archaeon]